VLTVTVWYHWLKAAVIIIVVCAGYCG